MVHLHIKTFTPINKGGPTVCNYEVRNVIMFLFTMAPRYSKYVPAFMLSTNFCWGKQSISLIAAVHNCLNLLVWKSHYCLSVRLSMYIKSLENSTTKRNLNLVSAAYSSMVCCMISFCSVGWYLSVWKCALKLLIQYDSYQTEKKYAAKSSIIHSFLQIVFNSSLELWVENGRQFFISHKYFSFHMLLVMFVAD